MRLKNLFFPLMLVLSFAVIMLYGWPAFSQLNDLKKTLKEDNDKLTDLKKRSASIGILKSKIASGGENVNFVYSYLPQEKREDRIIDAVNFVASSTSGIGLSEISIEKSANNQAVASVENSATTGSAGGFVSTAIAPQTNTAATTPVENTNLQFLTLKVAVSGNYADIKAFLDRLNSINIYNVTKSVSIEHVKSSTGKEGTNQENQDLLSADISIDFGYAPALAFKNNLKQNVVDKGNFDFTVLDKIRSASQITVPEVTAGSTGNVENPFKL